MSFKVEFTPEAEADLDRLFDFLLDRAETLEDALHAQEALAALREAPRRCSSSALGTSARRTFTE